jgi:polyphosphate kinase
VLLHHPFDSFQTVVDLLKSRRARPGRAGDQADAVPHRRQLADGRAPDHAARNGKDVTVVVELRARFDEEANIRLADRLQEAGVQVVYGVVGYKTHAKMLLIVRREGKQAARYVHLGTGNYHAGTARPTPTSA